MSHFPIFVIDNEPEAALAPFSESLPVPAYDDELDWQVELVKAKAFWAEHGKAGPAAAPEPSDLMYLQDWNGGGWEPRPEGGYVHYTIYNPLSKWDWYAVGGRWSGELVLQGTGKGVDECEVKNLDVDRTLKGFLPHALLVNGRWLERGRMGWFGMVLEPMGDNEWEAEVREVLATVPDPTTRLTLIDCHI